MNATMKIEKEYKEFLNTLKNRNITAQSVKHDKFIYNNAAEKTLHYLSKVALQSLRNRKLINSTDYEFDMFADDITIHILRKLDAILACNSEYIIPFIIMLVNNEVITICRKWKREHPSLKNTPQTSNSIRYNADETPETESEFVFFFPDDITWSLIADDTDLEEDIIQQETMVENRAMVRKALKNSCACSRFELVSLMATKVITVNGNRCIKTRTLAEAIDTFGLNAVSESYFEAAADIFEISRDTYFSIFTNDCIPTYSSIEELCDKISKASNNCAVKLCKKMGAIRATKKRA